MRMYFLIFILLYIPVLGISQTEFVSLVITGGIPNNSVKNKIETSTSKLLSEINNAYVHDKSQLQLSEQYATSDAIKKLNDIWKEHTFYCKAGTIQESILKRYNVYQIRNIPCLFGNDEQLEIVIDYASDGRVDDFYIALEVHQYKSVLESKGVVYV